MSVTAFPFGLTSDGTEVKAWRIENGSLSAVLIEYGAALQSLRVPSASGESVDVVMGYDTVREYEENSGFAGATIGRFGNRLGGASFTLNGREYRLDANDGVNHLHGGSKGFDRQLWQGSAAGVNTVTFSRTSPDGEENYPGNLDVCVSFTLTESSLEISYDADTDRDTVVNLTNHSYFNLNGGGSILDHHLRVAAEKFTEIDPGCLPTGRILPVENTPFDFRKAKAVGSDIDKDDIQLTCGGGYDHNFVLTGVYDAALLFSPVSGIRMTLHTEMPGVQIYSSNNLEPRIGKGGILWTYRNAICLETQLFPNAMKCYGFPSPVLRAGQHLSSRTVYEFSCLL